MTAKPYPCGQKNSPRYGANGGAIARDYLIGMTGACGARHRIAAASLVLPVCCGVGYGETGGC